MLRTDWAYVPVQSHFGSRLDGRMGVLNAPHGGTVLVRYYGQDLACTLYLDRALDTTPLPAAQLGYRYHMPVAGSAQGI